MTSRAMNVFLRRKGECKARLKLRAEDAFIEVLNDHTHQPSPINSEIKKIQACVKERASSTNDTSGKKISGTELQDVSEAATDNLLSLNNMRRNIQRNRDEHNATYSTTKR